MITLEECIEMTDLTREEIDAICEHEHIPEVAAAAYADYLMHRDSGLADLHAMIRDDIRDALARGNRQHAASLLVTLRRFLAAHRS